MKITALGKWLLESWGNKEVADGDYDFAVLMDVVQEIADDGKLSTMKKWEKCTEVLADAIGYGLITE